MRGAALAVSIALLLGGCAARAPSGGPTHPISHNRRELPAGEVGLLTGRDGVWTIYSSDADRPVPVRPLPRRVTLLCEPGVECDPPVEPR
jgi:hypothetical protein